jgi:hypothetical protein
MTWHSGVVPQLDLAEETFVVADPRRVADIVADPLQWARWWPELELTVFQDRGEKGIRWTTTGALVGSSEIWVEPWGDGAIVHYYLRADPTCRGSATRTRTLTSGRRIAATRRWARGMRASMNELKDALEGGRKPGQPRVASTA